MVRFLISTHLIRKDNKSVVKPQVIFFLLRGCGMHRKQHTYLAINQGIYVTDGRESQLLSILLLWRMELCSNYIFPGSFTRIMFEVTCPRHFHNRLLHKMIHP